MICQNCGARVKYSWLEWWLVVLGGYAIFFLFALSALFACMISKMKTKQQNTHYIEATERQFGAYIHDDGGMKWASYEELTALAKAHGFDSFRCLLDKIGVPFAGTISGCGRRFKAVPDKP